MQTIAMNAEHQRRLHNIATIGTVIEIDADAALMRLAVGDNQTDWLSIPTIAAGMVSVWRCPTIGEQYLLVSPSFLSHLCGGEVHRLASYQHHRFLSHLCGGEALSHLQAVVP